MVITKMSRNNRRQTVPTKNQEMIFGYGSGSITPGVNQGFGYEILDLTALVEATSVTEGQKIQVSAISIEISFKSNNFFISSPIIVQTAATVANQNNLGNRKIREILDTMYDDEFGYDRLGPMNLAKPIPIDQGHAAPTRVVGYHKFYNVPKKICKILTRFSQTERMQDLRFCLAGVGNSGVVIYYTYTYTFSYILVPKEIIIR